MSDIAILDKIQKELGLILESLSDFQDDEFVAVLEQASGLALTASQRASLTAVADELGTQLDSLADGSEALPSPELVLAIIGAIKELSTVSAPGFDPAQAAEVLLGCIVGRYLWEHHAGIGSVLAIMGVLDGPSPRVEELRDAQDEEGDESLPDVELSLVGARFRPQRIPMLLRNPEEWAADVYGWGEAFDFDKLRDRVYAMMLSVGFDAGEYSGPFWMPSGAEADVRVSLFRSGEVPNSYAEVTLSFNRAVGMVGDGVALSLSVVGELESTLVDEPHVKVSLHSELDLTDGASLVFLPNSSPGFALGAGHESGGPGIGELRATVEIPGEERHYWLNSGGFHICSWGESLVIGLRGDPLQPEFIAEVALAGLEFGIDTTGADSFLSSILTANIDVGFDLVLGYGSETGFHFGSGASLEITIPIHRELAPVFFEEGKVGIGVNSDAELDLYGRFSFNFELGPFAGVVRDIGLGTTFPFDGSRDDALSGLRFLPPTGTGLSLDAAGIVGGGFLEFDAKNKRYAGIVQLTAGELELTGIGLITTRMPDGSDNFSLLINIGVEFSTPLQLSFGFTLSGVGGLIGLNRTMMTDVLREGLRSGTLDSVLFPQDPITNAARIISDLRSVLPPAEERVVVGPMIKLGWGTPRLIQADLGIFIEFPAPIRIALLGQISASLPDEDHAVIELHIDVLGVLEPEKQSLSIDATLYDSRIYTYALTGDAAARFSWGDNPALALSLGGFHPSFSPPARFPDLRRLTLNLSQGRNLQLYCQAYQAVTANTVQFGATVVLSARRRGATVEGTLSFDTLIYLSPFSFEVAMAGNVVGKYKRRRVASVGLRMRLSGPIPWRARGRASFEVLAWDVTVKFNKTWGPRTVPTIEAVDPWPLLRDALCASESWGARLPARASMVEILAPRVESEGAVLIHPTGTLEVRQRLLPLGATLQKLGNAPVSTYDQFDIANVRLGGELIEGEDIEVITEDFAPAQFRRLSDTERLAGPAFEKMKAGVAVRFDDAVFEMPKRRVVLTYESILLRIDGTSDPVQPSDGGKRGWPTAARQLRGSAGWRSGLRSTGRQKFEVHGKAKQVRLVQ